MPESARVTCLALGISGFVAAIFAGVIIVLMSEDRNIELSPAAGLLAFLPALGGVVAAVLVWNRVPFATVPAMLVGIFFLFFVPIGTLVGAIVLAKLFAEDTRRYLA